MSLRQLFLSALFVAVFAGTASADLFPTRHVYRYRRVTVYRPRSSHMSLQPFSFRPMHVAYYAPRAERAPQFDREADESNISAPIEAHGSHPTVAGNRAVLRGGVAYAPSNAPENVKSAIWAVNTIRNKPYHWGGGHGSFLDSGYDCSGTVSFALHHAGVLSSPLPSSDLQRFGERGRGKWITIYARNGHTFASIAGLRLDTTDFRVGGDVGPRWHTDGRDTFGYAARHPVGL